MSDRVSLNVTVTGVLLTLLLTHDMLCSAGRYEDYMKSPKFESDALKTLHSIKIRLQSSRYLTSRAVAKRGRWRRRSCRSWREPCAPWSSVTSEQCCDQGSQVCQCNLWMQNCRCASRAWG